MPETTKQISNGMKSSVITFLFLVFTPLSFAESYPNSCPVEAQSILSAVGGCSAINSSSYSVIWNKCCTLTAPSFTPSVTPMPQSPAPSPPAGGSWQAPSVIQPKAPSSIKSPSPAAAPRKRPAPLKFITPFSDLPYFPTSTGVSEPAAPPKQENKLQAAFDWILRLFRFH